MTTYEKLQQYIISRLYGECPADPGGIAAKWNEILDDDWGKLFDGWYSLVDEGTTTDIAAPEHGYYNTRYVAVKTLDGSWVAFVVLDQCVDDGQAIEFDEWDWTFKDAVEVTPRNEKRIIQTWSIAADLQK